MSVQKSQAASSVTVVPYQQAALAVAPTIVANIVPGALGATVAAIVIQHPAAIPHFVVMLLAALTFGVMLGLRFAASRFGSAA